MPPIPGPSVTDLQFLGEYEERKCVWRELRAFRELGGVAFPPAVKGRGGPCTLQEVGKL